MGRLVQPLIPMSFPLGAAWHVACVWSRMEFPAIKEIEASGLEAYTPKSKHLRIIQKHGAGPKTTYERPLFPGYIFVRFDIEAQEWYHPIMTADGVREILCNQQIPMRVNAEVIDRFRRAEAAGVFDFSKPASTFREGDRVEVQDGPFAGIVGCVKSATARKRVRILMQFLGGATEADIDASYLCRA